MLQIPAIQYLLDDLNTAKVIAALHELTNAFFKAENDDVRAKLKGEIFAITDFLNLVQLEADVWFQVQSAAGGGCLAVVADTSGVWWLF